MPGRSDRRAAFQAMQIRFDAHASGSIRKQRASLPVTLSRCQPPREDIGHTHRQTAADPGSSVWRGARWRVESVDPIPRRKAARATAPHWTSGATAGLRSRVADIRCDEADEAWGRSGWIWGPANCSDRSWRSHRAAILLWSRRKRPAMAGRQPFWSRRPGGLDRNHAVDVSESASKLNSKDLSE